MNVDGRVRIILSALRECPSVRILDEAPVRAVVREALVASAHLSRSGKPLGEVLLDALRASSDPVLTSHLVEAHAADVPRGRSLVWMALMRLERQGLVRKVKRSDHYGGSPVSWVAVDAKGEEA